MTNLLVVIDRGPDAGPGECGMCDYLECNGGRYCELLFAELAGPYGGLLRCAACLAAEAAALPIGPLAGCEECRTKPTRKVGEELPPQDLFNSRHNLTMHLCERCFRALMGGRGVDVADRMDAIIAEAAADGVSL